MPTDSAAQRLLPHLRRVALARDTETGDAALLGSFVADRDEAAFAALVRRHGPMVLGVCRRVIGDPHLAEDAFQATFLVLARRAATVRPRHLVGHWLYGVAYRTALKARGVAVRRMAKEKQVDAMPHPPVSPDEAWADLQPVLDAELARLPEKYRAPLVLCDLGGRTQRDVARELRLAPATLARRLAAARRLLAKRLTQRGVALSASAITAALGWHAATSAVSSALAKSTVKAACAAAAGSAVTLPVPVVQLSEGVMRMFVLNKLKNVATGVVTCLAILAGLGLVAGPTLRAGAEDKPMKPAPPVMAEPPKPADPHQPPPDDLSFLRRISLDLRGTQPTRLEIHYFVADTDPKKRTKIIEWMLPEHGQQKATARCITCHKAPDGPPATSKIPYLNQLFRNVDGRENPHGAVWVDVDNDGNLDMFLLKSLEYSLEKHGKAGDAADKSLLEKLQLDVDQAKANLMVATANREKAAKIFPAGYEQVKAADAEVAQAKAQLAAAEEGLRQAQAKPADGTRWRLDRATMDLWLDRNQAAPTDLDFLRRVILDVTGQPPTTVEEKYFEADKDPKKREKLLGLLLRGSDESAGRDKWLDELLADPDVRKRWAEIRQNRLFKERMRAARAALTAQAGDRLDRLLDDLVRREKSDEQMLNALCLATMARYPTETEQNLILEAMKGQPDRRAAWQGVLRGLAGTEEAKAHAAELGKRGSR